jgi:hypothetical protein
VLHKETVEPGTLELIRKLQNEVLLSDFFLVGGTALSLQIGHRISDDIDLFSSEAFNSTALGEFLEQEYEMSIHYMHQNTLKGMINHVLVDLLTHNYEIIEPAIEVEGIRMLAKPDIAAMKVNAIAGNGTRIKDFIDLYYLLQDFSFHEIIEFYKIKYNQRNDFHAVKSLTFFDDIDEASWPRFMQGHTISLGEIKSEILRCQKDYLNNHG